MTSCNHILDYIDTSLNQNIFFIYLFYRNWLLLEALKGPPPWCVWREQSYCQWKKLISSLPRLTCPLTRTCKGGWSISSKNIRNRILNYEHLENHPKQIRALIGLNCVSIKQLVSAVVDEGAARVNYYASKSKANNLIALV